MSAAVYTATTPGMDRASSRPSTPESSAWGKMERTKTARNDPSIGMFSMYLPSPRRNRGSSVRRAGMPNVEGGTAVTSDMVP